MNNLKTNYFSKFIVEWIEWRKSKNIPSEDEVNSFLETLEDEWEKELFKAYINELWTDILFAKASVEIYRNVKNKLDQNDFTIFTTDLKSHGSVTMAESYIDEMNKLRLM